VQLDPGTVVDRKYEVLAPLAEGGMGAVYRARHLLTEQIVALKVLNVGPGDEAVARRFKLEVSVAAKIKHPGIVKVFDAGTDASSERFYLAMELLEGESLRDFMERPRADHARAVRLLADTLEVMVAAHAQGVVHRDLKPENLFLEDAPGEPRLRVLDFGIARDLAGPSVTTTGVAVGTALYMAPEQATASKQVGPAADVWAFGAMLYEVLTGERPFDGPSAHAVVVEAVTMPHRPVAELRPDLSAGWGALVDACLTKKPEGRPGASEVLRDLRALLDGGEALEAPFPLATPRSVPEDAETAPASAVDAPSREVMVGAVDSLPQPSVPPPAPSPRRAAWVTAGALAVALAGAGAWLALRDGGDATADSRPAAPQETPTEAPEAEPPPRAETAIEPDPEPAPESETPSPAPRRADARRVARPTRPEPPPRETHATAPEPEPPEVEAPPTRAAVLPGAVTPVVRAVTPPPTQEPEEPPAEERPSRRGGVLAGSDAFQR